MLGTLGESGISYREVHRITNEIVEIDGHDRWDMEQIFMRSGRELQKPLECRGRHLQASGWIRGGWILCILMKRVNWWKRLLPTGTARTEGMQELWKTMMSEMETFQRTGINFYIFNSLFQLLSLKDSEVMERTSRILFIPCYINYLLTGKAYNELTISSTSQFWVSRGSMGP